MDEDISNFAAITNADPQVARGFLDMSGGNLEAAIQLYFENPDLQNSFGAAGAASVPPSVPDSTRPSGAGRQDEPIQIDSDDEDADMIGGDDDDDDDVRETSASGHRASGAGAAPNTQEEADAAMAKRLQEELYGSGPGGPGGAADLEGVRSPIRATRETLVAPSQFGGGLDDDDGMDMSSMIQQQMRARREAQRGGPRNPFNHDASIWDDDRPSRSATDERSRRLADLFRPPHELMSHLDWDEARAEGKDDKKWILVNFQDNSIFQCQMLNRDIWKDEAVASLVRDNFIFLQYTKTSLDAQQFAQFYFPSSSQENPDNFPHVSIIDPRTGEQVKVWSGAPFPSATHFHAQLAEFLDRYSLDSGKKNPVANETTKRPKTVDVDRMTEEEMLEMALQNSMAGTNGAGSLTPKAGVSDPDALTKAVDEKNEPSAPAEPEAAAPVQSAFASIASDRPHAEPENNPGTTTRIQFRHPSGRVIRRFNLDEPVRRIYEWLKAEPLEGKEGIEFELKQMPQGQDLVGAMEKTITEAGLKQGTVMIEFLE